MFHENNPHRKDNRVTLYIHKDLEGQSIVRAEADVDGVDMVAVTEQLRLTTPRGPAGMLGEALVSVGEQLMEADDAAREAVAARAANKASTDRG